MKRYLTTMLLFVLLPLAATAAHKPVLKNRTVQNGIYTERFKVLASDTAKKHGQYSLIYKGKTIESGEYRYGERVGVWEFYNIHNKVEFRYDYDSRTPFNITPHKGQTYTARTFPSIYLGSPLVPVHFITHHTYYPLSESEDTYKDCKVVLALQISKYGKMTGFYLKEKSKEGFNNVVSKAAEKIPKHWRWVPARKDGRNVDSEYLITVIFEAIE